MKTYNLILRISILSLITICAFEANAQKLAAYQIYTGQGKRVSFQKMMKKVGKADLVFFGESHDLSIVHWLELEVLQHLASQKNLVLGMEMFEADEQKILDAYQEGTVSHDSMVELISVWSNYETDYRSIVKRAVELNVKVVGTNAPEDVPRKVFREGFDALSKLSPEIQAFLPELPIPYDATLPGYKKMLEMDHGDMNTENFPRAQAIRDATMAHHILPYLDQSTVLHLNGSYHSDHYEGIGWYIKHHRPATTTATISTVTQGEVMNLHEKYNGKADFIICVPEQMPRSYHSSF